MSRRTFDGVANFVQALLNVVVFLASYAVVVSLRLAAGIPYDYANDISVRIVLPPLVVLFVILWIVYRLPVSCETPTFEMILNQTFVAAAIALGSLAISFGARAFAFPRSLVVSAFFAQIPLLSALNYACTLLYRRWRPRVPVICVGMDGHTDLVAECLGQSMAISAIETMEPSAVTENLISTLCSGTILILERSVPITERDRILRLSTAFGVPTRLIATPSEVLLRSARVRVWSEQVVLAIDGYMRAPIDVALKRCLDIIVSLCALVVFAPVFLWAAVAILLEDGKPIFYVQRRLGYHGAVFQVIKFRTMGRDAELGTGPQLSEGESDPRITRTGRFLRRTGLDEVPQFINVLHGEMSVVGPRPERPELADLIEQRVPGWNLRLLVKPGITGLAQLNGRYLTSPDDKLTMDLAYITAQSLFIEDLGIILQTLKMFFLPDRRTR